MQEPPRLEKQKVERGAGGGGGGGARVREGEEGPVYKCARLKETGGRGKGGSSVGVREGSGSAGV